MTSVPVFVLVLVFVILRQFFGPADAGDDVLHVVDGDGHRTFSIQLFEQFGDTLFYVVGYFFTALLLSEGGTERLNILLQQFIGILVNLEKAPAQVDGNVLLHFN